MYKKGGILLLEGKAKYFVPRLQFHNIYYLSQTSFGHISTNSSMIPMVSKPA